MLLKQFHNRAGNEHREEIFEIVQAVIQEMVNKIINLYHNDGLDCAFREIDLNSIQIDPVQDYYQTNGYSLAFTTITKF